MTRKPSKNDMQNYLISKVLFDDKKPVAVVKQSDIIESPSENISDTEDVALDDEYIKENIKITSDYTSLSYLVVYIRDN